MVRLFVSVPVAVESRSLPATDVGGAANSRCAVAELIDDLKSFGRTFRTVPAENLHLTLKFLAEVDPALVPDLTRILGSVASRHKPFRADLRGVGVFPDRRHPAVVWIGVEPPEPLQMLALDLDEELRSLGFWPENRPFVPHLTLARIRGRPPAAFSAWLNRNLDADAGPRDFDQIELMSSERLPQGSRYSVLAAAELRGD